MIIRFINKFKRFRPFCWKLLLAFLLTPSLSFAFGKSRQIIGKGLEQSDVSAINMNFDKADQEDLNSVHQSSTETIHGYKYFKDPVNFTGISASTITASSVTFTAGTITTLTGTTLTETTGTITNIVSSSVGTNQIVYNNGTKLVGSSNMTYDGTTISLAGTFSLSGTWDGWIAANETWTYISSSQFSVPGDVTTKYQKGDKIKLTQTTAKYFYVTAVAAGVSVTTVTVTGGTDYTLANAAITSPFYSKMMGPQSFPTWFNYSPTITFTAGLNPASPGNNSYKFKIEGKSCTVQVFVIWGSAGTTVTRINFTPPVPIVVSGYEGFAVAAQNGLPGTQVPGVLEFTNGENLNGYFASGTVDRYGFVCTYEF